MSGEWLKGALHVHTTESDGRRTPQEVVDAYKDCGYDFVVFTDHNKVTGAEGLETRGMVVFSGVEVSCQGTEFGSSFHLVAVGLDGPLPEDLDRDSAQATIDCLRNLGAVVFIAHPYWSLLTLGDLMGLHNYHGIEVLNAGCEWETRHGDSSQHWSWLMERDREVFAYAVDDSHWGFADFAGGWVMVRTGERSSVAIVKALASGGFYSSGGPTIEELRVDSETVYLRCSPVAAVYLIMPRAGRGWTSHRLCKQPPCERELIELEMPAPPEGQCFRIEVVDGQGRKAWTNAIRAGEVDVR
ncbi:MAG: PHP domain-containing protein [Armatimonadota bacterium]